MLKEIFQVYLNRLVDLSSRNRSLYLSRLIPSQMIDLNDLHFLNHHPAFDYIENLLSRKRSVPLIPLSDTRDEQVNVYSQRIKRLQNLVQSTESETGEKSLYVAWPYVEGKLINGQVVRCPLVFFPVDLIKEKDQWVLVKRVGDQPFLNKAFLLAYSNAYGQKNSNQLDENPIEDFSKDAIGFRNDLYQYVKQEFAIHFTTELYESKIKGFPDSSKAVDEGRLQVGKLELRPYAVLGQFSQKASFLIQDYEQLIQEEGYEDLENLFFRHFAPEEEIQAGPREDQLYLTFPLDASQEQVIKAVRSGQSVVVEGPPGTGKSQLICNLALDFISRGKKVLIVSPKRAALDVVFKRLGKIGFGNFLALVHDFRADKMELYRKIEGQIKSLDGYQDLNRTIDAIQLERQFSQISRTIEGNVEFFDEYKKALFNTEECGIPIKELYLSSQLSDDFFDMTQYYKKMPFGKIDKFLRDLKEYGFYYKKFQNSDSFWLHRVDFSDFGSSVQKRIQEVLREILEFKEEISLHFDKGRGGDISYFFILFNQKKKLSELKHHLSHAETRGIFDQIINIDPLQFDLLWLEQKMEMVKSLLSEEGVEWNVQDEEVEEYLSLALSFKGRSKGLWDQLTWALKKKKFDRIFQLLEKNGLPADDYGNEVLITRLENRLNLNHQYTLLSGKEWLHLPDKFFTFSEFNHFSTVHLDAIKGKLLLHDWEILGDFLRSQINDAKDLLEVIDFFEQKLERFELLFPKWNLYLSKIQIQHLFIQSVGEDIDSISTGIPFVFDELVAFDRLRSLLSLEDKALMEKLLEKYSESPFEEIQAKLLAGLKLSWIEHIEAKYPVLKEISTPKALSLQQELMEAVVEKWELSKYISELRVREHTYKNLEFNRLGNLLTYRELSHQVSKKRRLWSVKKLLEEFGNEVFKLIPCWLASPETVSALFPLKQDFDLVIFDESSQCYVERGFPAMLRGRQVVVAGDSKQLQPFDIYQVRLEGEEEGIETETDSLLDLVSKYFQKFWLQSHYRSEQLGLIQFSNQHFYENRLNMLPHIQLVNSEENPFSLIKTEGIWDKQMNRVEAEEVIFEIKKIQKINPEYSIGVITFNYFQMELIQDLIGKDELINLKNIAVKNIENVQGDEFDWVIFSIGYARNSSGKLIANFGMLSKKGGINRLNVAITRARKKITLITSLSSRDFKPNQLQNDGIKMLQDYISFVEDMVKGIKPEIVENKTPGYEWSWFLRNLLAQDSGILTFEKFQDSQWMDLAIKENGQYIKAVLTDDQRLYKANGAKEAFAYHALQLKEKGWPCLFYFSRQHWMGKNINDVNS
ncbi:AAA domain-containing protein [Fontibacter flavus]|uniref:AAA domain-containing protein n=1 Tax=Fontibacter flavus TaxID=654838 RepID=A0ABV6FQD6_9BACT